MKKIKKTILALLVLLCMLFTMEQNAVISNATEISGEGNSALANGFSIDNTGTLVGYSGVGGDIVIPAEVTAIAGNVFAGNTSLTSVTLPANVAMIGSGVFANCTSLTTVTIQGSISTIPAQTFYNCENLRSVYVPASVTAIGTEAFSECISLSGITIPAAVTSIGERAFYNCISLSGVSIPDAVSSIGSNAFTGCSNMTSYSVSSGNGHYASSGGCLYNKTMTKLLSCPEGRSSVSIPDGTKVIGSRAFYNCGAIHSLTLPASVTTIESDAFAGSGISDITILSGVTSIGAQSGWTASIIYGESNSAAENYANSNSIVFQPLDASDPGTEDPGDTETEASGNTEKPAGNGSGNGSGAGTNGGSAGGNGSSAGTTAGTNGGSATVSGGTAYGSGTVQAAATAHQKDVTPKTGDGINPVFFFCIAFLLIGVGLLAIGKRKSIQQGR